MRIKINVLILLCFCLIQAYVIGQTIEFSAISPIPDSRFLNPEQNIILKSNQAFEYNSIKSSIFKIVGTKSGLNNFKIILSDNKKTIILKPLKNFILSEEISVSIYKGLKTTEGNEIKGKEFVFFIKEQDNLQFLKDYYKNEEEKFFPIIL